MGYCYIISHKYNQHKIYIGSTKDFKRRERNHNSNCHNINEKSYKSPVYVYIRKHGGIKQWNITEVYNGHDYLIFEKNYIKSTWEYNLNASIPLLNKQEWKDINNKKAKKYRNANRAKINEYAIQRIACDICGVMSCRSALRRHQKSKKCMAFK